MNFNCSEVCGLFIGSNIFVDISPHCCSKTTLACAVAKTSLTAQHNTSCHILHFLKGILTLALMIIEKQATDAIFMLFIYYCFHCWNTTHTTHKPMCTAEAQVCVLEGKQGDF